MASEIADPRGFLPSLQRDLNLLLGDSRVSRRTAARSLRGVLRDGANAGDVRAAALSLAKPLLRALGDDAEAVRETCAEALMLLVGVCARVPASEG
jgi:hypothetical protein